jgi:hypothetical protein
MDDTPRKQQGDGACDVEDASLSNFTFRESHFYCRWLAIPDEVARYLVLAGDRSAWTSDGRTMIGPFDDKDGVPLVGEPRERWRAMRHLLDQMEDEGLIISKVYPDGEIRRGLTDKGKACKLSPSDPSR